MAKSIKFDLYVRRFKKRKQGSSREPIVETMYAGRFILGEKDKGVKRKIRGEVGELPIGFFWDSSDESIFCIIENHEEHIRFTFPTQGNLYSYCIIGQKPETGKFTGWSARIVRIHKSE